VGVFFRREVMLGNQLWGDGGFGHGNFFYRSSFANFKPIYLFLNSIRPTTCGDIDSIVKTLPSFA
jgi:hypothetical protein